MMSVIEIEERKVGDGHPPFIIAEVGINHNGDAALAVEMIRAAKVAGADAVKFQTFRAAEFVTDETLPFTYRSQGREVTEPIIDLFRRVEFEPETWFLLKQECDRQGIMFLSTPQNQSDLDLLLQVGIGAIKVGSDDLTNLPLLQGYIKTGLPLILSTGFADLGEIHRSLETAGVFDGYPVALLLCTSNYPTQPEEVNMRRLATLRAAFPSVVPGFSDHTLGAAAATLAVGFGALVFEKHFTLSHDLPGPDHWFSSQPDELKVWCDAIRTAHRMLGSPIVRPTANEMGRRWRARRGVVATHDIAQGESLGPDNLAVKRPATGLPAAMLSQIYGMVAAKNIKKGEPVQMGDFYAEENKP